MTIALWHQNIHQNIHRNIDRAMSTAQARLARLERLT